MFADLRHLNPAVRGEDAGHILFGHDDGRRALFDGNRHLDHAADNHRLTLGECLVEGSKGTLTLSGDGCVRHRAFRKTGQSILLEPQQWPGFGGDCVFALQSHVIAALREDSALENRACDYLRILELEQAIYHSAETGAKVPV